MARMHSRKKGKSKSTKPVKKTVPSWVKLKPKEVETLIVKYAKEGNGASKIGILMRDKYGIPDVKTLLKKSITQVLEDNKLTKEVPEDLLALIKKAVMLRKHMEENHKDMPGKRGLELTESKIRRLSKYYISTGKLASTWRYNPEKVKILVQ
jgi:small subunit ribosomal protein S15